MTSYSRRTIHYLHLVHSLNPHRLFSIAFEYSTAFVSYLVLPFLNWLFHFLSALSYYSHPLSSASSLTSACASSQTATPASSAAHLSPNSWSSALDCYSSSSPAPSACLKSPTAPSSPASTYLPPPTSSCSISLSETATVPSFNSSFAGSSPAKFAPPRSFPFVATL